MIQSLLSIESCEVVLMTNKVTKGTIVQLVDPTEVRKKSTRKHKHSFMKRAQFSIAIPKEEN